MKYHQLVIKAHRRPKRVGRGLSAGQGKTAGRGTKGQKSRTGSSKRAGFSGGQNPLMQQLPKLPGFKSHRQKPALVKISQLAALKENQIDANVLTLNGIIKNPYLRIKLVAGGQLNSAKNVKLASASAKAVEVIEQAGGSFQKVGRLKQSPKQSDSKS